MKQKRGISYSRSASKKKRLGTDLVGASSSLNSGRAAFGQSNNGDSLESIKFNKKRKTTGLRSCTSASLMNNGLGDACKAKLDTPG